MKRNYHTTEKNKKEKKKGTLPKAPSKEAFTSSEKKLFFVAGLAILIIGFFATLFLASPVSVGKAFAVGTNTVDATLSGRTLTLAGTFLQPVSSVYVELKGVNYNICDVDSDVSIRGMNGFSFKECDNVLNVLTYGVGSVDPADFLTQMRLDFTLNIPFPNGNFQIDVVDFSAYSVVTGNDLFAGKNYATPDTIFSFSYDATVDRDGDGIPDPVVVPPPAGGNQGGTSDDGNGDGTTNDPSGNQQTNQLPGAPGGSPGSSSSSSSSSGGGCSSEYRCGSWSLCNSDLEQKRTCVDTKCREKDKIEKKSCVACDESWVCSPWSSCSAGKETRNCLDEHSCGTALYQPIEQRSCVSAGGASTNFQQQPYGQQSFSSTPSPQQPAAPASESFLDKYDSLVVIVPSSVVGFLAILFIAFVGIKRHRSASNIVELIDWIREARGSGSSDNQLRDSLFGTAWNDRDIKIAFKKASS